MATAFFSIPCNKSMAEKLKSTLFKESQPCGACLLWTGEKNSFGYGVLRFSVAGKRVKFGVHRLAYFVEHPDVCLALNNHVSHLCHVKLCIQPAHLSYEPQAVNNSRKSCVLNGECSGHYGFYLLCALNSVTRTVGCDTVVLKPSHAC